MNDIGKVSSSSMPQYNGIGQDGNIGATSAKEPAPAIQIIQQLSLTQGSAATQHNGSLVSNANGAPQLGNVVLNLSPDDLAAALVTLQSKTQEAQLATAKEGLNSKSKKIEDQKQRSLDKIKDWADKCKAADAKAKTGGILGWFKKIFTAVAAAFAVVAAGIATAVTGGAAAPLLALSVLGLASTITSLASDINKAKGGQGFDHVAKWMDPATLVGTGMAELAKKLGADETQAAIVATTFAVTATIAIIVASVVLTGGSKVADGIGKLSEMMQTVAKQALSMANSHQIVAGVADGATQIAQGAVNIAVAHDQRDAAVIQADKKMIDALLIKLQQQMEEGREDIKKVMDEIMEGMSIVSQMINATSASRAQITANMSGKGQTI